MKFKKLFGLCILAVGLTVLNTSCGIFGEDDLGDDPFYRAYSKDGGKGTGNGSDADIGKGDHTGAEPFGPPGGGIGPHDDFITVDNSLHFEPVYFAFDQSVVPASEYGKLDAIVHYLQSKSGTGVVIEGNCDSRGTEEYNRALGERRALSAKEYITSNGIDGARIKTVSYGEEKPAVVGETEEAYKANRRAEFLGGMLKHK